MTAATRLFAVVLTATLVGGALVGAGALGPEVQSQHTQQEQTQQTSYVRVIHASPDAPAVDVALDNQTVLEGVAFGDVSDYLAVPAGTYNLTISVAGDSDAVVLNRTLEVQQRSVTTIAASGEVTENRTDFELVRYLDDAYEPGPNESALSVFHLSPDAPAVDITAANGSVVLADNVTFREASDYMTVPAGNYTVEIRAATETNDGPVVTTVNVSLEGGTAYSALALGYLNAEEAPSDESFRVALIEDATKSVNLPGDDDQNQTMTTTTMTTMTTMMPNTTSTETATETPEYGTETKEPKHD